MRIESGALHLTTLLWLREVLSESNVESVAEAASGKTKRHVEELVARLAPKSDVVPSITQLASPVAVIPGLAPQPVVTTARVVPLSENRFEVRFTANTELRDEIERAKDLLRHRHPNGDLEAIMNRAFDALLGQLERERLGKVKRPREPKTIESDRVQQATRREVFERDGERCTYVDDEGNRCPAKGFLELDHRDAKARGGKPTTTNMRVLCRPHNRLHAEQDFGEAHVAAQIHRRQQGWPTLIETARSGLSNLGFKPKEIASTLDRLESRHEPPPTHRSVPPRGPRGAHVTARSQRTYPTL